MVMCQQRFVARDTRGNSLTYAVEITIKRRTGQIVDTFTISPGRTVYLELIINYNYHAESSSPGWRSENESEFRACTPSPKAFIFGSGGGGSGYGDTCSHYVRAADDSGNPLSISFDVYKIVDGSWQHQSIEITPDNTIGLELMLDEGETYQFAPDPIPGGDYETPDNETMIACPTKDTVFEYIEIKEKICTPRSKKCQNGDVYRCNNEGTAWEFYEDCPNGCKDGECEGTVCTPDSFRCNGDNVEKCKSNGSGWQFVKTCPYGCSGGKCNPEPAAGQPVVTRVTWSPDSNNDKINVGSTVTKRDSGGRNHTLKLTSITDSPLTANLSIDGEVPIERSEGGTFTLAGRAYQVLSVVCGPECDFINIAKTTTTTRPVAGDEVTFSATVAWNDSGATNTTRVVEWWCASQTNKCMSTSDLDAAFSLFATTTSGFVKHTFNDSSIKFIRVKARNKAGKISEWYGANGCSPGFFFAPEAAPGGTTPGFNITVSNANNDALMVRSVSYNNTLKKWVLGGVVAEWDNVRNGKYLAVKDDYVGCGSCDPAPSNCGVVRLLAGSNYAVYRKQMEITWVNASDVYKLGDGITNVTVSQCYESILEITVCGFFDISGSECTSFVAELYDPIYIANYAHIMQDGKDIYGNERQLTLIDHLALPFAVIGTIAPDIPMGSFVSRGGKGAWAGGKKLSQSAVEWMSRTSVKPPKILSNRTWQFAEAIVHCSPAHIDEIMEAISVGNYGNAKTLLEKYATTDIVGYWSWKEFNHALYNLIGDAGAKRVLDLAGVESASLDSFIKSVAKSPPAMSRVDDAVRDPDIIHFVPPIIARAADDAAKMMPSRPTEAVDLAEEVENVCHNAPKVVRAMSTDQLNDFGEDLAKVIGDERAEDIVGDVVVIGGDFVEKYTKILNLYTAGRGKVTHNDVIDIIGSVANADSKTPITQVLYLISNVKDPGELIGKLNDGSYTQVLGNFFTDLDTYYGAITEIDKVRWAKAVARMHVGTVNSNEAAKLSDFTSHTLSDVANVYTSAEQTGKSVGTSTSRVIKALFPDSTEITGDMSDDMVDSIGGFSGVDLNSWHVKARRKVNRRMSEISAAYKNMTRQEKLMAVWFMMDNVPFYVYLCLGYFGYTAGTAGFRAWSYGKAVTGVQYSCSDACDDGDAELLAKYLPLFEEALQHLRYYMDEHRVALVASDALWGTESIYDVGMVTYEDMEKCLAELGGQTTGPTGNIHAIAETEEGYGVRCVAEIKSTSAGSVYRTLGDVYKSGTTFKNIVVGGYYIRMLYSGYEDCIKRISVNDSTTVSYPTEVKCIFKKASCPKPVPRISDVERDEDHPNTLVLTGTASSTSPITKWEWDFGDGKWGNTQVVSHNFPGPGTYTVQLSATNRCGKNTVSQRVEVRACKKPVPSIQVPGEAVVGEGVTFRGSSTTDTDISNWTWDFGDGNKAYSKNSTHSYRTTGRKTVQLTVEDDCGVGTTTKQIIIDEAACTDWIQSVIITKDKASPEVGDTVKFTGSAVSTATITSWDWTLYDGTKRSGKSVSVRMTARGYYTIQLRVENACDNVKSTDLKIWVDEAGVVKKSITIKFPKGGLVNW